MSKAPVPGRVKTRLVPLLGEQQAADTYSGLVERTLQELSATQLCPLELHCAPDTAHPFFAACADRYGLALRTQASGDLGERMLQAIRMALRDAELAVLVGCDCPSLSVDDADQAIRSLLSGSDVVLGPASDGGYYLVGMRTPHDALFRSMPWGTAGVLDETHARIRQLGLSFSHVDEHSDIDSPGDYLAWQRNDGN